VRRFAENKDVVFGDVNLSEEQVRGNHNPGAGGWPTIRYFNKETGYEGKAYTKKTDKAMCDELGSEEYMDGYIMDAGNTFLCSAETLEGCNEKEQKFIEAWKSKTPEEISKELARIEGIKTSKMSDDQKSWFVARVRALKQLDKSSVKAEL